MLNAILVFLGAGFGGLCRYWLSSGTHWLLGRGFPYGTLAVNASGSFVMGFIFVLLIDKWGAAEPQLRPFLLVGFLGGYTSFSAFSMETLGLIESGQWVSAFLNISLSIVICIVLTWLGSLSASRW